MREASTRADLTPRGTLDRLERFMRWTDLALPVPGTRRTVGVDAALGLVPVVGSFIGTGLSRYLVAETPRHRAPATVLAQMGINIAIDTLLGAIPVIGFFFDFVFPANDRNMKLLREHPEELPR